MRYYFRIFILLFCWWMVGCSLLPNEMKIAERVLETNPDSALYILQHLHPNQNMTDADQALYGLLLFQALDKNKLTLKPVSFIDFSINYYQSNNENSRLATCYFYKARMLLYSQHYDEATLLYLKALDNSQKKKDYALLGRIYGDMGDICYLQHEFDASRQKYQLAFKNFLHIGRKIEASYRLLDIGKTYYSVKAYKTAEHYFRKALTQTNDSILTGLALQEIAVNYYYAKQFDSAQHYLRQSLCFPNLGNEYAVRCYTLADLYYNIKQYDSAYHYASLAIKHPSNFYTQRECYRLLANTSYIKGDFKLMADFMTRFQSCTDSVRNIESQTKTSILEGIHSTSQTAGKTKKYLVILGWILPVIVILGLFVFFRLRIRNKEKEQELDQVEHILNEKQILLRNNLIQKIEESKNQQAKTYKRATPAERDNIDREIYNICLHLNNWDEFSQLINHTFNNLIIKLETNYPDISHKEITCCCLFLLNVPTSEMLLLLDYKLDSLYKLKQRLVQKMNLKNAKDLNMVIDELVAKK